MIWMSEHKNLMLFQMLQGGAIQMLLMFGYHFRRACLLQILYCICQSHADMSDTAECLKGYVQTPETLPESDKNRNQKNGEEIPEMGGKAHK